MEKLNTRTIHEKFAIFLLAAILITCLVGMCSGCGVLGGASDAARGAGTVGRTLDGMDGDRDGTISFIELLTYILGGYFGGRTLESAGKFGVRKIKNGHKHGRESCEA